MDDKQVAKKEAESNLALTEQSGLRPDKPINLTHLTMGELNFIGKAMAASGAFKDIKTQSAALVRILAGQEMGLGPFASMSNISIIEGNASLGGHIMAARVKASDKYDYKVKKWEKDGCTIEFFEDGESIGVSTFDKDDALAAGLLNKHNWKAYPRNMYFNRAVSNGVRTYCPDVLGNAPVYDPDELGATVNETGSVTQLPVNSLPAITENADSDIQEDDPEVRNGVRYSNPAYDEVAEVTDEEIAKLETTAPEPEVEQEIKKPDFGDKPSSNLPKPAQRKFLKSIANESDIQRASQMVLDKSSPATFTDFNTVIDFIMTGEMPEQTSLIGDDDGNNNKE